MRRPTYAPEADALIAATLIDENKVIEVRLEVR
jgi:hypothetical protein